MRKAWRKGKREEESRRQAAVPTHGDDLMRGGVASASFGSGAPGSMQHIYQSGGGLAYPSAPGSSSMGGATGHVPRYSAPHAGSSFMSPPSNGSVGSAPYAAQSAPLDPSGRPYSSAGTAAQQQQHHQQQQQHSHPSGPGPQGGLGAYLMAHRGSI